MQTKTIGIYGIRDFVDQIINAFPIVIGPMDENGLIRYGIIKKAEDLIWDNARQSPKSYFLPHGETFLKIRDLEFQQDEIDNTKRAIFITPVDMMGLTILDHLFLDSKFPDPFYQAKRKNTTYIVIKTPLNKTQFGFEGLNNIEDISGYDIYIEKVSNGYNLESITEMGDQLLKTSSCSDILTNVDKSYDLKKLTKKQVNYACSEYGSALWEIVADKCLSCGSCTTICPTCGCYDVVDYSELNLTHGKRVRLWDGCQFQNFTKVASGEIFRSHRADRFKHRYYHKIKYYPQDYNVLGCVGCGRCIDVCPTNIDMFQLIQKFAPEEGQKDKTISSDMYKPEKAKILKIIQDTENIKTYTIETGMKYKPGQFLQVSVPLIGEAPISICSYSHGTVELNVRAVGSVTKALDLLKVGDSMYIRGPYGNGYDVDKFEGKDVLIIAGGTGVAPVKGVINYIANNREKFKEVDLYFGFRTPADVIFKDEIFSVEWTKKFNVNITVDKVMGCVDWSCDVGVITNILTSKPPKVTKDKVVIVCGPPIMIKYTLELLEKMGFKDGQIWTSLERMMKCGVGKCGHCMINGVYVCKDGPVFNLSFVKNALPEV